MENPTDEMNNFNENKNNEDNIEENQNNEDNQDNEDRKEFNQIHGQQAALATLGGTTTAIMQDETAVGNNVADFKDGMEAITEYYGAKEAEHIRQELAKIDKLEENTIFNLRQRGELTKKDEKDIHEIKKIGINPDNLTLDETKDVLNYALTTDKEIENQKTNRIYDALVKHINSPRNRHDGKQPAFYNEREIKEKERLMDKFVNWSRGGMELDKEFDVDSAFEKLVELGYEPSSALRRHLEEESFDDLYEEGLVDEDSIYIYGPFTERDLTNARIYEERTWTTTTNSRFLDNHDSSIKGGLSDLLDDTIRNKEMGIEADLTYDYVANEILQKRRLPAKELTEAASAIALDVLKIGNAEDKTQKEILNAMRNSVKYISYYLGNIFGRSSEELKDRFGSTRPLNEGFFKEMVDEAKNLSEARAKYIDENYKSYLTKMDGHLHKLLKAMAINDETSSVMDGVSEELD